MEKQGGFGAPGDCSGGPDVQWADQGCAERQVVGCYRRMGQVHGCKVLRRASGTE